MRLDLKRTVVPLNRRTLHPLLDLESAALDSCGDALPFAVLRGGAASQRQRLTKVARAALALSD